MEIIDGLPPGSTIQAPSILGGLGASRASCRSRRTPRRDDRDVDVHPHDAPARTGAYAGYNRIVSMGIINGTSYSAPRVPFASPQAFLTDFYTMQGSCPR